MFIYSHRTDFIITASQDGHVKFWKKKEEEGIEFVKHFRSHLGTCPINRLASITAAQHHSVHVFIYINSGCTLWRFSDSKSRARFIFSYFKNIHLTLYFPQAW